MTSRPILFSPLLAKAICAGAKTQTRRPISHPFSIGERDDGSPWPFAPQLDQNDGTMPWIACPFGLPGDRLWVRETFSPRGRSGEACRIEDAAFAVLPDGTQVHRDGVVVQALAEYAPGAFDGIKWRPSIHMPRWASRITLEIVGIRAERLHSISDVDVVAEGVLGTELHDGQLVPASWPSMSLMSPMKAWKVTWSASYGTGSWDRNPWVWAIEFRRLPQGGVAS